MAKEKPRFGVIIAGSRKFEDYNTLEQYCDYILQNKFKTDDITIISGGARGADQCAEMYAERRKLKKL